MKKWLIWCLTVLAMVCLIPGTVLNVKAAETVQRRCARCGSMETREILGYRKYDSTSHRVYVTECQNCHNDGNVTYLTVHTGGTQGPTCTEGKICEKCGAEYDIPGHVWGEWTPNGNGTHTRRCTNPNCDAKEENVPCGGDSRATCIRPGTCTTCGGRYDGGHDWGAWRPNDDGTHTRRCTRSNCDGAETENCSGGTATCSAKAVCKVCGGKYGIRDLSNHALVHHAAKAPTCTEKGWNAYETCSRCDYTTYAELPALNHALEQHEAQAPTCTEIGWDAYETCSRCDYTTRTELPALNHALEQHAAKAPTCTEPGWDAYETCSRCDYTTRKELPALNHALEQHEAKAPTCTEKGWSAYETCSRCDYTTYAELPILGHDYQAVTVAPTCETDGYTVFTCSHCKDSYTADPTDQLGHQFGAWSPNGTGSQSASCLRQGCAHTGSTDCRKFTFRTAEGEALTFCPVCGQAENAAQLEMIEAATAWANSGSLSAEDVTARTNGEYLSVAFETAGSLTQPTGRVRLALPAGLLEGKKLVRIAPDGTQTEMPFETERGKLIYTLDFANSALPVMLFRLVPQPTAL